MNMIKLMLFVQFFLSSLFGNSGEVWKNTLSDVKKEHLAHELSFHWAKDPFLKVAGFTTPSAPVEKFELGAILFDLTKPIALINGIAIEKGDLILGRTVVEIGRNYVVLERDGSLLELVMPPKTWTPAPEAAREGSLSGNPRGNP